ncbi:hypothetical protein OE749_01220 [Aestuariibacter sp. AA17]|uniref:Conjugal transfer mating pair stabilization protein TraN n=1 Tax=Fluctibacter corallii TaxID=2984329 RepID=A0ABT3A3R2_9ALTE|nr:hypothetical protein [Aestuariibacter sp. AA17]MCV2883315.1 hypothetical protein [Aestuariibacter sp. AA17]
MNLTTPISVLFICFILNASQALATISAKSYLYADQETCPAGYTLAPVPKTQAQREAICDVHMNDWDIARLSDNHSISGSGYQCEVVENDSRTLGHAICEPAHEIALEGDMCPSGYEHITKAEVSANPSKYCAMLPATGHALLADAFSLSGTAGHCDINPIDDGVNQVVDGETYTAPMSLCAPSNRVKKVADCPVGTELLIGSNTTNFCINEGSNTAFDHYGVDMCAASGKGDFLAIKRVYTDPLQAAPTPTLICEERTLPVYSALGTIEACPLGSERVKGQSAPDHCAYIWGELGKDVMGNDVCDGFGEFKEYIQRIPRRPGPLSFKRAKAPASVSPEIEGAYVYSRGERVALCTNELQPKRNDLGEITECPPYAELIVSPSVGNHCALKGGDPGFDIANDKDVCEKAGEGRFERYLTHASGAKLLVCSDEKQAIPEATKLVQTKLCGTNEEFIKSALFQPSVYDHCAPLNGTPGFDVNGKDVCKESGLLGFQHYSFPAGVKTLICECPSGSKGCDDSGEGPRAVTSGGNQPANLKLRAD